MLQRSGARSGSPVRSRVAAHRHHHEVARAVVRVRAIEPERRDRADDQVRMTFAQARGVEAVRGARAGRGGVEPDVGAARRARRAERGRPRRPRSSRMLRLLVLSACQARLRSGPAIAADPRPAVAQRLALGRLDRDHVGAEVAEDLAGELAGFVAEVEDADAVEHEGRKYNARRVHGRSASRCSRPTWR